MLRPTRQTRLDLCRSERSAAGPVRCAAWGCPAAPRAKPQPCGRGDAAGGMGGPPRYDESRMARIRRGSRGPRVDGAAVRSQRQPPNDQQPGQRDRACYADGGAVDARLSVGARPRRDHRTSPRPAAHTSASGTARARKTTRPTTNCAAKGRRGIMRRLPCPAADRDRA